MKHAGVSTLVSYLRQSLGAGSRADSPDAELLARFVATGEDAAFEALVRRHGAMVWGVCQRLLAHRQDAEDAFQATFLVLARKAATIARREQVANWLFGVARRLALNARARRRRRAQHEQLRGDLPDRFTTAGPLLEHTGAEIAEELARLPEKYRLPLLLCCLEGMTHAAAGHYLGWPTGTVAGRLSRGRELLRTRLRRRGVAVSVAALALSLAPPAGAAAAALPLLITATLRSAAIAATVGTAGISPSVATLLHGMLRTLVLTRVLTTAVLGAVLCLALGSGGYWLLTARAQARAATAAAPELLPALATRPERTPGNGDTDEPGTPLLALPADPTAVVIRLERTALPGTDLKTSFTIHADGRVIAALPEGLHSLTPTKLTEYAKQHAGAALPHRNSQRVEWQLSTRELQDLVRFAVFEEEFFTIASEEVAAEYAFLGKFARAASPETSLCIQTAERSHEVRWPHFTSDPSQTPPVKRLAQIQAVDMRLRQLFAIQLAGGRERVADVLKRVNEQVQRHYPTVPQLTVRDLRDVVPAKGSTPTRFTFGRGEPLVGIPEFWVQVELPPHEEPRHYYWVPAHAPRPAR